RDRQRTRELAEIDRVLCDVGLKALAAERARRELDIEREPVDRLPYRGVALPGFFGKPGHCASPEEFTSISNSRSSCTGRSLGCGSATPRRISGTVPYAMRPVAGRKSAHCPRRFSAPR